MKLGVGIDRDLGLLTPVAAQPGANRVQRVQWMMPSRHRKCHNQGGLVSASATKLGSPVRWLRIPTLEDASGPVELRPGQGSGQLNGRGPDYRVCQAQVLTQESAVAEALAKEYRRSH